MASAEILELIAQAKVESDPEARTAIFEQLQDYAQESGAFSGLLWNQYFVQSPAAQQFGVARYIPWWVAPQPESAAIVERTFLHHDWLVPILLLVAGMVVGKIASFTGGGASTSR